LHKRTKYAMFIVMDEKKYKTTLRIPTKHQYAYIEIEIEGTKEEIMTAYVTLTDAYHRRQAEWDKDAPPF